MQIGLRYSNSYSYSHSYCYCNSQSKCYCHCYSYSAASGAAPAGTRGERKRFFEERGGTAASGQVSAGITHRAGASEKMLPPCLTDSEILVFPAISQEITATTRGVSCSHTAVSSNITASARSLLADSISGSITDTTALYFTSSSPVTSQSPSGPSPVGLTMTSIS